MGSLVPNTHIRMLELGNPPASKATGTLAASTVALFTITGGLVVVTSIVGTVTTAITVANAYKLQSNPTTGTTTDICSVTDLGTSDTAVGDLLTPVGAGGIVRGGLGTITEPFIVPVGQIEHVSAGTDGAITWKVTWYPYDDGATLVAV